MSDYAYGAPVPLTLPDANGAAASLTAYAEVVLTITQPDGTSVVKKKSDATLTANPYNFTPAQSGRHVYYFVTTTPDGATEPQPFYVDAAADAAIVSLADVKAELNIPAADTTYDSELQSFTRAATRVVEVMVGKVAQSTVTEWHDGGSNTITLRQTPVVAVTSVTEYIAYTPYVLTEQPLDGATFTQWGYTFESTSYQITRRVNSFPATFSIGERNVKVVYTSGRAVVPDNIRQGALELIRVNWAPQQGFDPAFGTPADEVPGNFQRGDTRFMGFFIPNRVRELLMPDQALPGIA